MSYKTEFTGRVGMGLVLLEVPSFLYPIANNSVLEVTRKGFMELVLDKMSKYTTGEIIPELDTLYRVASVGENVSMVKPGDCVKLANRVSPQILSEHSDGYPHGMIFQLIRHTDIIAYYGDDSKLSKHYDYLNSEIDLSKTKELPDAKEL